MPSIKERLAALERYKDTLNPAGVGIVAMLSHGVWAASSHRGSTQTFTTSEEAEAALKAAHCDPIIIIDL